MPPVLEFFAFRFGSIALESITVLCCTCHSNLSNEHPRSFYPSNEVIITHKRFENVVSNGTWAAQVGRLIFQNKQVFFNFHGIENQNYHLNSWISILYILKYIFTTDYGVLKVVQSFMIQYECVLTSVYMIELLLAAADVVYVQ